MIQDERFEIALNRPENGRWWVPRTGFQNQFVTGTTRSFTDNDRRNYIESSLLGRGRAEYDAEDADLKPKYAFLRPLPTSDGLKPSDTADKFGSDVYVFDVNKIRSRITWSVIDSGPLSLQDSNHWSSHFLPWDKRAFLAPYLPNGKIGRSHV